MVIRDTKIAYYLETINSCALQQDLYSKLNDYFNLQLLLKPFQTLHVTIIYLLQLTPF